MAAAHVWASEFVAKLTEPPPGVSPPAPPLALSEQSPSLFWRRKTPEELRCPALEASKGDSERLGHSPLYPQNYVKMLWHELRPKKLHLGRKFADSLKMRVNGPAKLG